MLKLEYAYVTNETVMLAILKFVVIRMYKSEKLELISLAPTKRKRIIPISVKLDDFRRHGKM